MSLARIVQNLLKQFMHLVLRARFGQKCSKKPISREQHDYNPQINAIRQMVKGTLKTVYLDLPFDQSIFSSA